MSLFSEIEKTIERGFRRWTAKMFGEAKSDELLLVESKPGAGRGGGPLYTVVDTHPFSG